MRVLFFLMICSLMIACGNSAPAVVDDAALLRMQIKKDNDSMLSEGRKLIQSGDLILRTGTDYASDQVKTFSKTDKTYSHGGIAVVENDSVFIYHVEPDFRNIEDKVRKEPFEKFCDAAKNFGYGIARYNFSEEEKKKFLDYLNEQYEKQVPFDMGFSLASNDSMYCSEMITKGLALSTNHRIQIKTDRIDDRRKFKIIKQYFKLSEKQFVNREIINIDQLFLNPECKMLQRYVYRIN